MKNSQKNHDDGEFEVTAASDNIFSDLGFPDARAHLEKVRLALKVSEAIQSRKLTQAKAAAILGTDQPKVSKIMRGVVREFSLERLMDFAERIGMPHEVTQKRQFRIVASVPAFQRVEIRQVSQPAFRLLSTSNDISLGVGFLSSTTVQRVN